MVSFPADPGSLSLNSRRAMTNAPPVTSLSARQGLLICAALVLALKGLTLVVDPTMRLFMGDSGSYIHTALTGWIPPDRSFLYGWLIGATAVPTRSINTLLLLQSSFGALSAILLYAWLAFGARVRPALAIVAAALFALEPAQLFYERMVMAEAAGFLSFALFFVTVSAYVATGRPYWIALFAVLGVLAVALRISLLPVVLVLSLIVPSVRTLFAERRNPGRGRAALRFAFDLALALACTVYAHDYYKRWYGELAQSAPGYTANAGIFRLGLVAPLVEAKHFDKSGVSPDVLREVKLDYRDPRMREAQVWSADGLIDVLRRHSPDPDRVARKISIKAVRDNPLGLVRLGLLTVADYFDPEIAKYRLEDDLGRRGAHHGMIEDLKHHLRYDATGVHQANTPATRWFVLGSDWLTACLLILAPLSVAALWLGWNGPRRELRVVLALTSIGLVVGHVLFSHIVSYRYLHPLPWFVLANLALLPMALQHRRGLSRAASETPSGANSGS